MPVCIGISSGLREESALSGLFFSCCYFFGFRFGSTSTPHFFNLSCMNSSKRLLAVSPR